MTLLSLLLWRNKNVQILFWGPTPLPPPLAAAVALSLLPTAVTLLDAPIPKIRLPPRQRKIAPLELTYNLKLFQTCLKHVPNAKLAKPRSLLGCQRCQLDQLMISKHVQNVFQRPRHSPEDIQNLMISLFMLHVLSLEKTRAR